MKVLFLDIDGVLNNSSTFERYRGVIGVEPDKVDILRRIVRDTGIQLVLSSSWRIDADWRATMKEVGIDIEFLDATPYNRGLTSRGTEVKQWLADHPGVERFACLDDDTDFLTGQTLFKTEWFGKGLTPEIGKAIVQYFNFEA